ncbi:hypothetical protein CBR_g41611 [Chara braunii]|uniref:Uncharacterized protein n=1 Tax=Chara braunii TaxID=69332 RepID=A0A388LW48_CHABU|nr:hypothetical protein CBR_g41611 [Chara braunii]|eukprot:GBG86548.1 hypothetical protein CBR_g41611 [Chara braunii]
MSASDSDEGRVDDARLTHLRSRRVPYVFRVLQSGDERRLRAEVRARAYAAAEETARATSQALAAANAAAREQAAATANAAAMATAAASSAASSSGTQLGMPHGPMGTSGSVGSSQSTSQMAGSQFSPLTPRGRELQELQQVERIRTQLERELKQATDRENEIRNRTGRLDTLEADALEGLDESAMSEAMKVLRSSILSLHAHVDSRLDFMQNSLDQILVLLQRPGLWPAAQSPLPFTAMSGSFPVQAGTQPSGKGTMTREERMMEYPFKGWEPRRLRGGIEMLIPTGNGWRGTTCDWIGFEDARDLSYVWIELIWNPIREEEGWDDISEGKVESVGTIVLSEDGWHLFCTMLAMRQDPMWLLGDAEARTRKEGKLFANEGWHEVSSRVVMGGWKELKPPSLWITAWVLEVIAEWFGRFEHILEVADSMRKVHIECAWLTEEFYRLSLKYGPFYGDKAEEVVIILRIGRYDRLEVEEESWDAIVSREAVAAPSYIDDVFKLFEVLWFD